MTDLERRDVQQLLDALKRAEWAGEGQTCPVCRRQKRYGATHVCSCPIAISLVKVKHRLLGTEPLPEPEALADGVCVGDRVRFTFLRISPDLDGRRERVVTLQGIVRDESGVAELTMCAMRPEGD